MTVMSDSFGEKKRQPGGRRDIGGGGGGSVEVVLGTDPRQQSGQGLRAGLVGQVPGQDPVEGVEHVLCGCMSSFPFSERG